MWLYLTFLLIIGVGSLQLRSANHNHAWETGNEYHYLIKSRTLTALNKLAQQFSGIMIKGGLTIQVKSPDTLQAVVSKTKYAPVHKVLPEGWNNDITELEFDEFFMSGKSFEIKLKHGVIRDVLVDQDVPTWEVNLIKSIVSQLQIDLQGENVIANRDNQIPDDTQPYGVYKAMEDSVGGKCEVLYSITPMPKNIDSIPFPNLRKDGLCLFITKTKNYAKCEQRMAYHSGITGKMSWKPRSDDGLLRSSTNSIIISGHVKRFTIQSSLTTSEILVRSKIDDTYSGAVYSSVNLTLDRMSRISNPMPASNNLVSTGNLVYIYNNPFSSQRKPGRPSVSQSSMETQSSKNRSSSSEENISKDDNSFLSSSFNSKEREHLQPKPTLDEAPESPLLPYFIGYKGESIQKSEEDYALVAARLIGQITEDLEYISNTVLRQPYIEVLEPSIILVRLIRTMNVKQIAEVENKLSELSHQNRNKFSRGEDKEFYDQTTWDIFSNAVASAGTGPALISIKNWIKNGKLEGRQAANVISKIPKAALTPTAEYVKAFFELITDEQVTKQSCLNTSAPLAFAELVRYTQSKMSSNYYPVYSFGRMISRHDNALLEIYIPYMATQLREAIKDSDSRRIQTYIMALSNFGHTKVLSVFEPYLEGTLPVSKFQRLMMVLSLNRLSENFPIVARSVAYKIYVNIMEAYELRCAAVYVIMRTNPPLVMLQRMARFTNQDQDHHINSAVKTNIEALANLKQPEFQDLTKRARIAKELLNPHIDTENYSEGIFQEKTISSLNIAQTTILQIIGSSDYDIPRNAYFDILQSYGNFNLPRATISYTVSSNIIRELLHMWYQMPWATKNKAEKKLLIEETIEKLGIKAEDPEQFEGNIFMDTLFISELFPFDNHTIEEIINMFTTYITPLKKTHVSNTTNMNYLHFYDMTLAFPTESGLPFIYTLTIPKLTRFSSGGSYEERESKTERFMELTAAGHVMSNEMIQSRIGFVTPFEHKHYISGIDINTQFFIPAGLSISLNTTGEKQKIGLSVQPNEYYRYGTGLTAIHHSVIPYTARNDILNFEPSKILNETDNNTLLVHTKEPHGIDIPLGNIMLSVRSDHIDSEASKKIGMEALKEICNAFYNSHGAHYRRLDSIVFIKSAQISVSYDYNVMLNGDSSEATIPAIVDKKPESEARKEQFLKEVGKSMNSAYGHAFDISVFAENSYWVFTYAYGYSRVDYKSQVLFYWNFQSEKGVVLQEFCSIKQTKSQGIFLNIEQALDQILNDEFKMEMRFGSCAYGETLRIEGNLTRTDDVKEMAMKSEIVKKCRQEMKQGNIFLPNCQKADRLVNQKDLLSISIDTDSYNLYANINAIILWIQKSLSQNTMETMNLWGSFDMNTIDLEIKMPPDSNDTKISLRTSQNDVTFSLTDIFGNDSKISLREYFEEDSVNAVCVLDKTNVVTFDNKIYPLMKLGKCWHVLMTTYPKWDPNNPEKTLSILDDMRVMIMIREMDDSSKQVRMILGDAEIHLQKSGDRFEATVNGQVASFSEHESYREDDFEMFETIGMIRIVSTSYEIFAEYDGERIILSVSDKYLDAVRGLCGNYDMQSNNDFIVPENCILTNPEEFAATYAFTQDNCQGPALQNKRRAEQSTCISRSYRPSNVISDREAGRPPIKNRGWGYH